MSTYIYIYINKIILKCKTLKIYIVKTKAQTAEKAHICTIPNKSVHSPTAVIPVLGLLKFFLSFTYAL